MADAPDYVTWFRNSAPYINAHRKRTFVLMFPGEAVREEGFGHLVHDIALLHSLGVRLVLVHGARSQIEQRLARRGLEDRVHQGLRVTDAEAMECVIEAAGALLIELVALLSLGQRYAPMNGTPSRVVYHTWV